MYEAHSATSLSYLLSACAVWYLLSNGWHVVVTWSSLHCHIFVTWLSYMPFSQSQLTQECLKHASLVSITFFCMPALPSPPYVISLPHTVSHTLNSCISPLQYALHHHHAVRAMSLYLQGTLATHTKGSSALLSDLSNGCNDGDARVRTAALKALVCALIA